MQIAYQVKWQHYRPSMNLPSYLHPWVMHAGSFMERLRQQGVNNLQVQLVNQSWQVPELSERQQLGIAPRHYALIREVLILSEKCKWMVARTVLPRHTLTGKQRQLAFLKNRSLGSVLFKEAAGWRSEFEVACMYPHVSWYAALLHAANIDVVGLWARRSMFVLQAKPLLLTEVFLPDMQLI